MTDTQDKKKSQQNPAPPNINTELCSETEREFIQAAQRFLEEPSFLIRMASLLGRPAEKLLNALPEKHQRIVHRATEAALRKGFQLVLTSLRPRPSEDMAKALQKSKFTSRIHTAAAFGSGAVGGFVGWLSLPVELPLTTGLILRSIAATAAEFGFDLSKPEIQLECLYILSLGSAKTDQDDAIESAYWTSRIAFNQFIKEAAPLLSGQTVAQLLRRIDQGSLPILARLLSRIGIRFEAAVSQKAMAELLPVIGAAGGGLINAAFADFFSQTARYHFGLRALENKYGNHVPT